MEEENDEVCPFISKPCEKCYCFNLASSNITSFLYYCGKHFTRCEIYKKLTEPESKEEIY